MFVDNSNPNIPNFRRSSCFANCIYSFTETHKYGLEYICSISSENADYQEIVFPKNVCDNHKFKEEENEQSK